MKNTESSTSRPADFNPTTAKDRIEAIDVLRGFALLGIFVMNITGMALPLAAYFNPMSYGGSEGLDFGAWAFAHLFFDLKMMGIFSMLFGAGLIIMFERAEAARRPFGRIYYRRTFWLLLFGLAHAYLLWHGDILVTYALCGFVLFLFRRRSVRALIISGVAVLLFGALLYSGGGFAQSQLRDVAQNVRAKAAGGEETTPHQQALLDQWEHIRRSAEPTPEEAEEMVKTMREPSGAFFKNAKESVMMHTQAIPFMLFWRALGMMLLGMGLMKAGVFTAQRTAKFYRNWIIIGFGLGLPVIAFGIQQWSSHNFDSIVRMLIDGQYNYFASILVSMAYVSLVMLICQSGKFERLRSRLAAVGRTALTNYLLQTIIGVAVFYGYGLALFGQIGRFNLWWFILGVWALQLFFSPWWLRRFQFGPAEWLWRTLTYWRKQPWRVRKDA